MTAEKPGENTKFAVDTNVPEILRAIAPAVRSLQLHFEAQGQHDRLRSVTQMARLIDTYGWGKPPWA